ncbi:MAG TPA: glycosyl hydrolase [Ramlibacter sp.]|nr:glycosyl hydrolase [Ramlibacter sp.]
MTLAAEEQVDQVAVESEAPSSDKVLPEWLQAEQDAVEPSVNTIASEVAATLTPAATEVISLPAAGGAATAVKTVASSSFDESYTYAAPGWKFNYWGSPAPTYSAGRETRSGYIYSGSASQRFRTVTTAGNAAHFIYPFKFTKGRTYRTTIYLRADSSASVEVMMRRDAHPWDGFGTRTVTVGTTWQKVEIQGVYLGDGAGSIRIISKTPGANVYLDNMTLAEVSYNDLAPASTTATIPNTMFGVHVKKLGTHFNWPTFGQGIVRLWNTGTNWRDLEKANNVWDFTSGNGKRLELYVDYVSKNGGQMLYTLGQTPQWASSGPTVPGLYGNGAPMPPSNMEDWRDYVRTLARRYSGKIKYWELWNESDYPGTYAGSVEKMVEMARIAREELKAADPTNVLVSPGLTTGQGVSWLDRFLAAGGGNYVDNIGFHWYYSVEPEKMVASIQNVREVMRNHGVQNKPLWNTEGAPLCNSSAVNCSTWVASTAEQRSVNARAVMIMWAKGVSNFNYYFWENGESQRKLVEADNVTPTNASHAYAEAIRWLKGARFVDAYRVADKVYVVRMNRGTENYTVLWSTVAGTQVSLPSTWGVTRKRDLAGVESTLSGSTLTLGLEPVLLK